MNNHLFFTNYLKANKETRGASLNHWKNCYREALKANDETNMYFCAVQIADRIIANDLIQEAIKQ